MLLRLDPWLSSHSIHPQTHWTTRAIIFNYLQKSMFKNSLGSKLESNPRATRQNADSQARAVWIHSSATLRCHSSADTACSTFMELFQFKEPSGLPFPFTRSYFVWLPDILRIIWYMHVRRTEEESPFLRCIFHYTTTQWYSHPVTCSMKSNCNECT